MSRLSMLGRAAATTVVFTTAFTPTAALAATSHPVNLKATATGANVGSNNGSPTGSGSATFVVNKSKGTICYSFRAKGLTQIIGVHIHAGAAGVDGQVLVTMNAKKLNAKGETCVKESSTILSQITSNPSGYYFNIHTKQFPAGAVRGQLRGTANLATTTASPTSSSTSTPSPTASNTTPSTSKYGY